MRDFINTIGSLSWWLSVVIVGIIINLFSAYLKNKLDRYLSATSTWWQKKSRKQRAERQAQIAKLQSNPDKQIQLAVRLFMFCFLGTLCFIVAVFGTLGGAIMTILFELRSGQAMDLIQGFIKLALFSVGGIILFLGIWILRGVLKLFNMLQEVWRDKSSE